MTSTGKTPTFEDVSVGDELPTTSVRLTRETLVKYAGASGDFNPIHWSERAALAAGLPDVIAHGMLTMAEAIRVVTDWTGEPHRVVRYRTRFSRPVVVPDTDDGVELVINAVIAEKLADSRVLLEIDAALGKDAVLSSACAVVQLA